MESFNIGFCQKELREADPSTIALWHATENNTPGTQQDSQEPLLTQT